MSSRIPVIMDCDPGHDDAIAIMLAFGSGLLDIRGITTVAGNQTVEKTTLNALKMLTFLGVQIPVAKGASGPLFRELIIAPEVHGTTGLDGPELPDPAFSPEPVSAVQLMAGLLEESDEKITLIPTGALTNIAMLLTLYPHLRNKIERISLMGGAADGGNWTPGAEFNILVDPEAADIVFRSGIPVVMAGLDVTHKAIVTRSDAEMFRRIGTKAGTLAAELLDYFVAFHEEFFPQFGGSPLHDPCAVAYLLKPELFSVRECHVAIDTDGELTTGATVVDQRYKMGKPANAVVLFDINREGFIQLLAESFRRLA